MEQDIIMKRHYQLQQNERYQLIAWLAAAIFFAGFLFAIPAAWAQSSTAPPGDLLPLTHNTKAAQNAQSSPFKIRALHVPLQAQRSPISDLRPLVKQAGLRGYNTVIFLMSSNQWSTITVPKEGQVKLDGITTEQMKKLITFCRS